MSRYYLDSHAATPLADAVRDAMSEALRAESWGNPASVHARGRRARSVVERARGAVAASIGAAPADVVFTSGGTEACNVMVRGLVRSAPLAISAVEHPAVRGPAEARGDVRVIPVPRGVPPSPADLAPRAGEFLVLQWVNHEVGTLFPIRAYAEVCGAAGARLAVDATQAWGRVPIDVESMPPSLVALAIASHKAGGPPGAGALWVRRRVELAPEMLGGAQERGRRGGTPDPLALLGFGTAATLIPARLAAMPAVAKLRDTLEEALLAREEVERNGEGPRVASCASLSLRGWRGAELVAALDLEGVMASAGAACSSGVAGPSAVIAAMYPDDPGRAVGSLRLSLAPEAGLDVEDAPAIVARMERVLARTQT